MHNKRPDHAALVAGISNCYLNAQGQSQPVSEKTKRRLLAAMPQPQTPDAPPAPLPNVLVCVGGKKMSLTTGGSGEYHWRLTTEQGKQHSGLLSGASSFDLPPALPQGYHQLTLTQGKRHWHCRVIVAPGRCWRPPALAAGKKLWGACVQLYTLRSDNNWGIGDFGDLGAMLTEVASRGGAFIGLNPTHALCPATPENASPYSPSSRLWLNVIYIDVNAVEAFRHSEQAQAWWRQPATQQALRAARESEWVDYTRVTALKMTALRMAWKTFSARKADDEQVIAFHRFVAQGGESLFWQAAFDALHGWQIKQDPSRQGWPAWPGAWQSVDSRQVKQFCQQHKDEVDFYLWLQHLADTQFARCWQLSQQQGMPVGLYRDLAVGVAADGAETWHDRELWCLRASIGAPPDSLGPLGQNWRLPPMNPHVITARAYEPFINLLRANMKHCGALRIDHVMSLLRLWWIPRGETADQGAYVHYPVDDLLAILALESQRHRCMVIGEDLGTVPAEIVGKLRASGIYSYKVLYFEHNRDKTFRAPRAYPVQSMAAATTHDLPTLRGYWESGDLTLGETLGLWPDQAALRAVRQQREQARQQLVNALHKHGCLPKRAGHQALRMPMTAMLNRALQRYLADSNSALLGLQPEDWLDMATPVNIPGTHCQYRNWRRKLIATIEAMFADKRINSLLRDLDKRRRRGKTKPAR